MTTKQDEQQRVFVEICTPALHGSTAEGLHRVLEENRGWGNGLEDHIVQCSQCQRILKATR
jgi:hypothetical protein